MLKKIADKKRIEDDEYILLEYLEKKALIRHEKGEYKIFSYSYEGFVREMIFSKIKENFKKYFSNNKKTLISIGKYCIEELIKLKKG